MVSIPLHLSGVAGFRSNLFFQLPQSTSSKGEDNLWVYRAVSKVSEDGRYYQGVHILTPLPARSKHYSFPLQGGNSSEDQSSSERETVGGGGQSGTATFSGGASGMTFPGGSSCISCSFPTVSLGSPTCSDHSHGYGSMSTTPEKDMEQDVSDYFSEDSDDNRLMALPYMHDSFPGADQFLHPWRAMETGVGCFTSPPSMWESDGSMGWMLHKEAV